MKNKMNTTTSLRLSKVNQKILMNVVNERINLFKMIGDIRSDERLKTLVELGLIKAYISMNEAKKRYGRALVDMWVEERMIKPIKDGENTSRWRFPVVRLEELARASKYVTWSENEDKNNRFISKIKTM